MPKLQRIMFKFDARSLVSLEKLKAAGIPLPPTFLGGSMLKTFAYHKPSADGLDKITKLREAFSDISKLIDETCPNSREKSVALTNLETTAMWAIKSVVCNDPKSEVAT